MEFAFGAAAPASHVVHWQDHPERGARADFAFELDPLLARKRRDFTAVLLRRKPAFATRNLAAFLNPASLARVASPSF